MLLTDTPVLERDEDTQVTGPVRDIRQFALDRNREQSDLFSNAAARHARQQYRRIHPTEIAAFKCMDGRLNLSVMTETPVGILQPYRNIGGDFDLGWPFLGQLVKEWVNTSIHKGRDCLILATYHFSKGDRHRGCKGFGYDTDAARAAAAGLVAQASRVFGTPYQVVHPILVGIETDEDALVFHGVKGEIFTVADNLNMGVPELNQRFAELYPQMRECIRVDLLELVKGNQHHIQKVRASNRPPIDLDHREQIIAVGRGFDWLHLPNMALIIGPYGPEWPKAVATAGGIVLDNLKRGQLDPEAGRLLLIAKLAREERGSAGWNLAVEEAHFVTKQAYAALEGAVPELIDDKFSVLTGVVDAQTRLLHLCD